MNQRLGWHTVAHASERSVRRNGENAQRPFTSSAAGWPDQRATVGAARSRVYVALSTLRKLGLEPYLQGFDDGYVLASALTVQRESPVGAES